MKTIKNLCAYLLDNTYNNVHTVLVELGERSKFIKIALISLSDLFSSNLEGELEKLSSTY